MTEFEFIGTANVQPIIDELNAYPEVWNLNPYRQVADGPHIDSNDAILRGCGTPPSPDTDASQVNGLHISEWYDAVQLLPSAKALSLEMMAVLRGEMLGLVMLYEIPPGAEVKMHIDRGWHAEFYDKFNVCIETNDDAAMVFEHVLLRQKVGEIHRFRNDILHGAVNLGTTPHRILVVCLRRDRGVRVPTSDYIPTVGSY